MPTETSDLELSHSLTLLSHAIVAVLLLSPLLFSSVYQLCVGADAATKSKLRLGAPQSFEYLNQSGCIEIDGVDDAEEFAEVRRAMELLSFTKQEMEDIFSICAGVLHMGNIAFTSTGDRASKVSSPKALEDAAALLQVNKATLEQVCVTRKMQVTGQAPITIGLGAEEAKAARDALSKFMFELLFDWLVVRINKSIGNGGSAASKGRSIGILDIFGFEIFKKNRSVCFLVLVFWFWTRAAWYSVICVILVSMFFVLFSSLFTHALSPSFLSFAPVSSNCVSTSRTRSCNNSSMRTLSSWKRNVIKTSASSSITSTISITNRYWT